jgi:hypothetical protein
MQSERDFDPELLQGTRDQLAAIRVSWSRHRYLLCLLALAVLPSATLLPIRLSRREARDQIQISRDRSG